MVVWLDRFTHHKLGVCITVCSCRQSDVLKAFVFQCLMQQSLGIARQQQKRLMVLDDTTELLEVCSILPLDPG
jgi:hypothetical protein